MYYIGIEVSTKESALCVLDGNGKIVRETKLPTDPEIIARFIADTGLAIERIGVESGCTAAWLFAGLQRYGATASRPGSAASCGCAKRNSPSRSARSPGRPRCGSAPAIASSPAPASQPRSSLPRSPASWPASLGHRPQRAAGGELTQGH